MIKLGYLVDRTDWKANEEGFKKLTHVYYAFAKLGDKFGTVVEKFERADNIRLLKSNNPNLKVCLSIGGWGADHFSEAAQTEKNRKRFSETSIEILKKYGFDGLDIDWEYPCIPGGGISANPADKSNFTLLLKQLRDDLNQLGKETNQKYLLTIAASGAMGTGKNTELTEIVKFLDFINVMTYDLESTGFASHHCNLFASRKIPNQKGGADWLSLFIDNKVPRDKLTFGIAFYGRGGHIREENDDILNSKIEAKDRLTYNYTRIKNELLIDNTFKKYWDDDAKSPYIYNGDIFVSYDDPSSIKEKIKYAKENNLAGVFFWQFKGDETTELINAIDQESK